jgi:TatD DNase family protein
MLIDTHLHLANEDYDIDKVIKEANNNNVKILILGGTDKNDNIDNIKLSKKYKNVFLTFGYHPESADEIKNEDYNLLEKQIKDNLNKTVAIGEIGLDYYHDKANKKKQITMFKKQIELAKKYNLPVVIHSREATEDTYNVLKDSNIKGIIHCFSGSLETAKKYIKLGFLLGIGGVVTFKNSNLKDVIKEIDLKNIVLETDSPYLSPNRGEKNEPKNIKIIAEYIANIKEITLEQVEKITTENAKNIFQKII